MRLIGEEGIDSLKAIDLATLPIGDNFTMGPDDALRPAPGGVKLIEPQVVIPIHYNTFDVITQDPHACGLKATWAERVRAETAAAPIVIKWP